MFGKTNPTLTERDVLQALKGVKDPDLGRDLVDAAFASAFPQPSLVGA